MPDHAKDLPNPYPDTWPEPYIGRRYEPYTGQPTTTCTDCGSKVITKYLERHRRWHDRTDRS